MPSAVRGEHVRAIAKVVPSNREHLAGLIVAEMGKPLQQALSEVDFASLLLSYSAEWDRRLEGEVLSGDVPMAQWGALALGEVAQWGVAMPLAKYAGYGIRKLTRTSDRR